MFDEVKTQNTVLQDKTILEDMKPEDTFQLKFLNLDDQIMEWLMQTNIQYPDKQLYSYATDFEKEKNNQRCSH